MACLNRPAARRSPDADTVPAGLRWRAVVWGRAGWRMLGARVSGGDQRGLASGGGAPWVLRVGSDVDHGGGSCTVVGGGIRDEG